jgi:ABC-type Fe3+/spermidine/putrescine transport system ATPase subunit
MTVVILKDLTRRFGDVMAVNHLNLEIESGELVAFLGPSGCGKTTTLRMIAGLLPPTNGDVLFDGESMLSTPVEKRGAVMVFQQHLLFPNMNVEDNVGFGLRMRGVNRERIGARVREMLELVHLERFQERQVHELSGGQQQRVALARALIIEPRVLLLDEPLANLDANLRLEMRDLIRNIQRRLRITTIFVTHDQEEAVMLADRVALMFDGVVQQYAPPRAFYERPASAAVVRFFRNPNLLPGVKRGDEVRTALGTLTVSASNAQPDGEVLLTIRPEDIQVGAGVGVNELEVMVTSCAYMGTHTNFLFDVAGHTWQAVGRASQSAEPGEKMHIHLPAESIWLVAPE